MEPGEQAGARMHSDAAAVRRRIDRLGSVRNDDWQRPRRPTVLERVKRLFRTRRRSS
jgi:hypothetical protein